MCHQPYKVNRGNCPIPIRLPVSDRGRVPTHSIARVLLTAQLEGEGELWWVACQICCMCRGINLKLKHIHASRGNLQTGAGLVSKPEGRCPSITIPNTRHKKKVRTENCYNFIWWFRKRLIWSRSECRMSEAQMAHLRKWQMTAKYNRIPTAGIRLGNCQLWFFLFWWLVQENQASGDIGNPFCKYPIPIPHNAWWIIAIFNHHTYLYI